MWTTDKLDSAVTLSILHSLLANQTPRAERMWRAFAAANEQQHKHVGAPEASDPELVDMFRQDLIRSRIASFSPAALCQDALSIAYRRQYLDPKQCTEIIDTSVTSLEAEPCISSRYVVCDLCSHQPSSSCANQCCMCAFRCDLLFPVMHLLQPPNIAAAYLPHYTLFTCAPPISQNHFLFL